MAPAHSLLTFLLRREELVPIQARANAGRKEDLAAQARLLSHPYPLPRDELRRYTAQPHKVGLGDLNPAALICLRYGEIGWAELLCRKGVRMCAGLIQAGYPTWWLG